MSFLDLKLGGRYDGLSKQHGQKGDQESKSFKIKINQRF